MKTTDVEKLYFIGYSKIVDGHPVEVHGTGEDKRLITDIPEKDQRRLSEWIDENIIPQTRYNRKHTSYELKHYMEEYLGYYISNNQGKDALLRKGYIPKNFEDLNWVFKISEETFTNLREEGYRGY